MQKMRRLSQALLQSNEQLDLNFFFLLIDYINTKRTSASGRKALGAGKVHVLFSGKLNMCTLDTGQTCGQHRWRSFTFECTGNRAGRESDWSCVEEFSGCDLKDMFTWMDFSISIVTVHSSTGTCMSVNLHNLELSVKCTFIQQRNPR